MSSEQLKSLQPESLMAHMRVLCQEIGPRPPTSDKEREAAAYVKKTLTDIGYAEIQEQPFKSQRSFGWGSIPILISNALAVLMAWLGGQGGKLMGGMLLLGGFYTLRNLILARPPFYQKLIARWDSQNLILKIPPTGRTKQTVFLIGHLDSQKQRFLTPPSRPEIMKPLLTVTFATIALTAISFLADVIFRRKGISRWQRILGWLHLVSLMTPWQDEAQPHIEGANDNATAVTVLLAIAEALKEKPLKHTAVTLLFTGCEEVMCVGMENYLQQFSPPKENSYWIDLEMAGTGNLCYVTKHGVSYITEYGPHPEMMALAEQTARKHPELRVIGKDMLIVEEVANLRNRDYKAICLAGYDENGWLPNWHRLSDNLSNIEPDTLSRAAQYTWALVQEVDSLLNG
jgi:hypothetical protein